MNRTLHPSHSFDRSVAQASLFGTLEWQPSPTTALDRHALGFAEPIRGLHVREIDGLAVLLHFFGPSFERTADVSH
jgi:hypothetical protein